MGSTETTEQRRPNKRPFARSFASALVFSVAGFLVVLATLGPPRSPRGAGYVFGTFLGPAVVGAAVTGLAAWRSTKLWPAWRYALTVTLVGLLFILLVSAGNMSEQVA